MGLVSTHFPIFTHFTDHFSCIYNELAPLSFFWEWILSFFLDFDYGESGLYGWQSNCTFPHFLFTRRAEKTEKRSLAKIWGAGACVWSQSNAQNTWLTTMVLITGLLPWPTPHPRSEKEFSCQTSLYCTCMYAKLPTGPFVTRPTTHTSFAQLIFCSFKYSQKKKKKTQSAK